MTSTVTFEYFRVTVRIWDKGTNRYPTVEALVCVLKDGAGGSDGTTRVSIDPWELEISGVGTYKLRPSTVALPAYPVETQLRAGECTRGHLESPVPLGDTSGELRYQNALGDQASWLIK